MKSSGLLKRFLDVLWRLVPEAKHDSAQKILHLRCVLQTAAKCILHPSPRLLRCAHDRVAAAVSNQRTVFRIANEEHSTNVAAREIRTHIEFAGLSQRRDCLCTSRKLLSVAKWRRALPTDLPDRKRGC